MNRYQIVMPNGDIMGVVADRMTNTDGDLAFYIADKVIGEARYWHAYSLVGTVEEPAKKAIACGTLEQLDAALAANVPPVDPVDAGMAYVADTIDRLVGRKS